MNRSIRHLGLATLIGALALAGCSKKEHRSPVLAMTASTQLSAETLAAKPAAPDATARGLEKSASDIIDGTVLRTTQYNPVGDSFALIAETDEGIYAISVSDCGRPYPRPDALWLRLQGEDTAPNKTRVVFARSYNGSEPFFTAAKMGRLNTCYIAPSEDPR